MLKTAILGYPRIGEQRELKKATEAYWKGEISRETLLAVGRQIRAKNRLTQKQAGIDIIPSNDFSTYDQVLDMTALLGAVPARYHTTCLPRSAKADRSAEGGPNKWCGYGWKGGEVGFDTYFAMARGSAVPAMEMTKWFDTNYHYIVPEFHKGQRFQLSSQKPFNEFEEALDQGIKTRPVLIGPVTYLKLGKSKDGNFSVFQLLDSLLPVYVQILQRLKELGAESVQMDEPALVTDLDAQAKSALKKAYKIFSQKVPGLELILTTYFGGLGENLKLAASLPVAGLHLDLVRSPRELSAAVKLLPHGKILSLGVIDGRNVWKSDLNSILKTLRPVLKKRGEDRCLLSASCSFLHCPIDLELEGAMDREVKRGLSFSKQKLHEINVLKCALSEGGKSVAAELRTNKTDIQSRRSSPRIHKKAVAKRLAAVKPRDFLRRSPFKIRQPLQRAGLALPLFPTTTIGSFPQTQDVRQARANFKKEALSAADYENFIKEKTADVIRRQREMGLDVFVHGEFERNDMVEYFGEQLEGFVFMQNGWVQSYGSRYVKPPIIYGDVERPRPMTTNWTRYAQSLTQKPVKGMLTGPITILQWSFVRDDQPRSVTARQIALAIRDEVLDLEKAGIAAIQIDEPAIREGLPLRRKEWTAYLKWAVDAFRLAANGVKNETQIHTHMCYSEFNDIIQDIAKMDADVISIETSRSQMELLRAFVKFRYPNEIGPGVYDIHSPRVPTVEEIKSLLKKAAKVLPIRNIWVNPDCGLKTRGWEETALSLKAMVQAAGELRAQFNHNSPRASHEREAALSHAARS